MPSQQMKLSSQASKALFSLKTGLTKIVRVPVKVLSKTFVSKIGP